ncbi:MAG TPA: choice-of-anchor Q domain-containing protein, partial [Isosphaeraceae bacterium]|nr:choice-of-anchor Q domain-containing protein [Isosphaeraceae bacterium]
MDITDGTATLDNTIIALNTDGTGGDAPPDNLYLDGSGTVSPASAYNLIGTGGGNSGLTNGSNGNQVGVADPGLGTLANNGGPTETIALLAGSPAIEAGSNALAVDK